MVGISTIARLQRLSDDDLLITLGDSVLPTVIGAAELSDDEKINVAKRFLLDQRAEIKNRLCNPDFTSRFEGDGYDRIELYAAIIDTITGVLTGVAVAVVAVLIVREGLKSLCAR